MFQLLRFERVLQRWANRDCARARARGGDAPEEVEVEVEELLVLCVVELEVYIEETKKAKAYTTPSITHTRLHREMRWGQPEVVAGHSGGNLPSLNVRLMQGTLPGRIRMATGDEKKSASSSWRGNEVRQDAPEARHPQPSGHGPVVGAVAQVDRCITIPSNRMRRTLVVPCSPFFGIGVRRGVDREEDSGVHVPWVGAEIIHLLVRSEKRYQLVSRVTE